MGRHRLHTDPSKPLPPGLYLDGRQYRARRGIKQPWQYFGTDYVAAIAAFAAWRSEGQSTKTVSWLMDLFVGKVCAARVKAKTLSERTARDYLRDAPIIRKGLGHIPLAALEPKHIAKFRNARGQDAPAHVRNEMACISSALSWAVEDGILPTNVAKEIKRPTRSIRGRLIADAEYLTVYDVAGASVRLAMLLCVRTLGLPSDVLRYGPRNVVKYDDGRKTLRFKRGKTGVLVEIEIVGELAAALQPFLDNPTLHPTFIRREDGEPYCVDGIGSMFRRHCVRVGVTDFGLRDLRAKGATDMFRADPTSIRKIQLLLGHTSVRTTEIYIKGLLAEIVRPNERPILAVVEK